MIPDLSSGSWTDDSMVFDDGTPIPLDFNTGSVSGQICECCTFDQSVIGFEAVPESWGLFVVDGQVIDSPILEFPQEIWRGKIYCDGCRAVTDDPPNGTWDRTLTRALRAAIEARDAICAGKGVEPFPYSALITVHTAPRSS